MFDRLITSVRNAQPGVSQSSGRCAVSGLNKSILASALYLGVASTVVVAEEGDSHDGGKKVRIIEEVMVSAQKREEVSQDVPISMSVLTDVFMKEQGVTDIADALLFTPNFSLQEEPRGSTPQCRGFTVDGGNPAFEPPCGIAIDGVAFTRTLYFSAGLMDLKRLEVLRGPQGTTFGKNTTAGVVSVVTKDPTDEFTVDLDVQYAADPERERLELGVGGPIIPEFLNFRLASLREDRQGYVENTTAQVDPTAPEFGGGRDRESYRVKLDFVDLFGTQLKLTYEEAKFSFVGSTSESVKDENSQTVAYYRQYDPNADFEAGNYKNSVAGENGGDNTSDKVQLDWNFSVGGWDNTLVIASGDLTGDASAVTFASPIDYGRGINQEESEFRSLELRTLSPEFDGFFGLEKAFGVDLGYSEFLVGGFYQNQKTDLSGALTFDLIQVVGVTAGGLGISLPKPVIDLISSALSGITTDAVYTEFFQDVDTEALFASARWYINEQWKLELAARYSEEEKQGWWKTEYAPVSVLFDPTGDRGFTAKRTRSESNLQPKFSLGYSPTDDLNFFVHWTRGYKGGGFNAIQAFGNPEEATLFRGGSGSLQFDSEYTDEWGIDAKMYLLDRAMQLNLSLYRMEAKDFQVLVGVLGTSPVASLPIIGGSLTGITNTFSSYTEVRNAAEATAQGGELDLTWLPNEWLTVIGAVGYNDTELVSYENGTCSPERREAGQQDPETGFCDLSGESFPHSSKWNTTLSLQTRFPLGNVWGALDGLEALAGGTVEYKSEYYASADLGAETLQEGFYRYRAFLGLGNPLQGWSFRITGLNLTDEVVYGKKSFDGTEKIVNSEPGRTYYAQFTWAY